MALLTWNFDVQKPPKVKKAEKVKAALAQVRTAAAALRCVHPANLHDRPGLCAGLPQNGYSACAGCWCRKRRACGPQKEEGEEAETRGG